MKNFSVCGARYKTRPGLTYHYTHSHKEKNIVSNVTVPDEETRQENILISAPLSPQTNSSQQQITTGLKKFQDSYVTFLNSPGNH